MSKTKENYSNLRFYKALLIKAYLDKGLGITHYVKYLIAFFGLASADVTSTLIIAVIYAILCFFIGWAWYHYKIIETEIEINNRFNLFVKEMRRKFKHRKV